MYGLYIIFLSWTAGVAEPVQFQTVAIYDSYQKCAMARDGYHGTQNSKMRVGLGGLTEGEYAYREENVPVRFACIYGPYGSDLFK